MDHMGKIIFYEDQNFHGRCFKCSGDCTDLQAHFSRCNSICLEHRVWLLYKRPNYTGSHMPQIRIYKRPDFTGQMLEATEDCPSLAEQFSQHEVHSCKVLDGAWILYDQPNYRGHQYLLERGEYRRPSNLNAAHPSVGSLRHIQEY